MYKYWFQAIDKRGRALANVYAKGDNAWQAEQEARRQLDGMKIEYAGVMFMGGAPVEIINF